MKRILALIIVATVLCGLLSACGKPSNVSQEMYEVGIAALQIADDYIAYNIDYATARAKIDTLSEDAQVIYERNKGTEYSSGDFDVKFYINRISISMISSNYDGVPSDIKDERDTLAHKLGK